jgi:DNA polymerase III epsilon subunit-like protein
MLEWSSFGGQNAQFDYRHIDEELHRQGLDWPRMKNYTLYSVEMLARPLYLVGLLSDVKQETMAAYFNLGKQTHDALDDVRQSVQIYRKLLFLCINGISDTTLQHAQEMEPFDMTPHERAPADV